MRRKRAGFVWLRGIGCVCLWVGGSVLGVADDPVVVGASGELTTDRSVVWREDFESGMDRWELIDPESWELGDFGRGRSLSIRRRESEYQPKVRSPHHIALIRGETWGDFELSFEVKSTKDTGNHRDCCIFFGYQDPTHFYYVHLGARPDPASGQIMIVNDAPRRPLTENQRRVPWDDQWHRVKLVRRASSGEIAVYFDDMTEPLMRVTDKTFGAGRVGLGSFDDMDAFDTIAIRELEVESDRPVRAPRAGNGS